MTATFSSINNDNFSSKQFLKLAESQFKADPKRSVTKNQLADLKRSLNNEFSGVRKLVATLVNAPQNYEDTFLKSGKITGEAKTSVNNIYKAIKDEITSEKKTLFQAALLGAFIGTLLEVSNDNKLNAYKIFGEHFKEINAIFQNKVEFEFSDGFQTILAVVILLVIAIAQSVIK